MDISVIETLAEYESAISEDGVVVIKVSASWCQPCRTMTRNIQNMENIDGVSFYEIDADNEELNELIEKYHVMSLPTILIFKNKNMENKLVGNLPIPTLKTEINKYL